MAMQPTEDEIRQNPWRGILPDRHTADHFAMALHFMSLVDPADLREGIHRIGRAEAIGPLIDPTKWIGGDRFENASHRCSIISHAIALREALPKEPI